MRNSAGVEVLGAPTVLGFLVVLAVLMVLLVPGVLVCVDSIDLLGIVVVAQVVASRRVACLLD